MKLHKYSITGLFFLYFSLPAIEIVIKRLFYIVPIR